MDTNPLPVAANFLHHRQGPARLSLFQEYARLLIDSSGACQLPIALDLIRQKYNFSCKAAPIADKRGFLVGRSIFVNSDDHETVQRFTEAHELMESLVVAIRAKGQSWFPDDSSHRFERDKEGWCEQGAAELLMPAAMFFPLVKQYGVCLATGRQLAHLCQTSLTATMRRMLDVDLSPCIFAILHEGYKKHQIVPSLTGQGVLWGQPADWDPPAELRVWKRWRSPKTRQTLRLNESFTRNSLTYQVLSSQINGQIREGTESLDLDDIQGPHQLEAMRVIINQTPSVMALIHL